MKINLEKALQYVALAGVLYLAFEIYFDVQQLKDDGEKLSISIEEQRKETQAQVKDLNDKFFFYLSGQVGPWPE